MVPVVKQFGRRSVPAAGYSGNSGNSATAVIGPRPPVARQAGGTPRYSQATRGHPMVRTRGGRMSYAPNGQQQGSTLLFAVKIARRNLLSEGGMMLLPPHIYIRFPFTTQFSPRTTVQRILIILICLTLFSVDVATTTHDCIDSQAVNVGTRWRSEQQARQRSRPVVKSHAGKRETRRVLLCCVAVLHSQQSCMSEGMSIVTFVTRCRVLLCCRSGKLRNESKDKQSRYC
jgi:hypothetical protein